MKRLALALGLLACLVALPAWAHPLGNFTTNLHLGLVIGKDVIDATLVVDMAEIPAFREKSKVDDR